MLPSLNELNYFLEVCRTGNMSRAADRLGITQPSLSLSIQKLESNIGTQLFIRTKSGVQLTPIGKTLQQQSRSLLEQWHQIRSSALKQSQQMEGSYTIGCHASVGLYTLKHFCPKLVQDNPSLEIHFKYNLSRKIAEEVISFNIDFGIVVNPIQHPDLVIKELLTDEVSFWCHKSLKSKPSEELAMICDPKLAQSQDLIKKTKKAKLNFGRVLTSGNLEVMQDLVENKIGVGILPKRVATRPSGHNLVPYSSKCPTFKDRICLVYRADSPKTLAQQAIISAITETIRPSYLDKKMVTKKKGS